MSNTDNSRNVSTNNFAKPSLSGELQKAQDDVNEVLTIMKENVDKVVERDVKLHDLDEKADALLMGSSQFHCRAVQARRKMWWNNMKMKIIMGSLGASLLILILYI